MERGRLSVPHRRSPKARRRRDLKRYEAEQRSAAKKEVLETSRRDPERAETICMAGFNDVANALKKKFEYVNPDAIQDEPGDVLIDSRGTGTFQQIQIVRR